MMVMRDDGVDDGLMVMMADCHEYGHHHVKCDGWGGSAVIGYLYCTSISSFLCMRSCEP